MSNLQLLELCGCSKKTFWQLGQLVISKIPVYKGPTREYEQKINHERNFMMHEWVQSIPKHLQWYCQWLPLLSQGRTMRPACPIANYCVYLSATIFKFCGLSQQFHLFTWFVSQVLNSVPSGTVQANKSSMLDSVCQSVYNERDIT